MYKNEEEKIFENDTSYIYKNLTEQYLRTGEPVEVDFRTLVNWVRLGDQLTHQIHPYPAKLLPHIAHFFVKASCIRNKNNPTILDPFCGSGTVALEASLNGLKPYIADANPFALLLAKVKTTPYNTLELKNELKNIIQRSMSKKIAKQIDIINSHLWYDDAQKKRLEIIIESINEISNDSVRDFFRICFTSVARKISFADPAISVPVRLKNKTRFSENINKKISERINWVKNSNPNDEFERISLANIDRVNNSNYFYETRSGAKIVGTDARNLEHREDESVVKLKSNSVSMVLTSPPYGSAQKYIRATGLALNWLGLAGPKDLSNLEGKSIGREHAPRHRRVEHNLELPAEYELLLDNINKKNEHRAIITRYYLCEMQLALTEIYRVTEYGGRIVIVIGNNVVSGFTLRNDLFIIKTLCAMGAKIELDLIDHIKSRGLMTKRNKTASIISRESVLVFVKQKNDIN